MVLWSTVASIYFHLQLDGSIKKRRGCGEYFPIETEEGNNELVKKNIQKPGEQIDAPFLVASIWRVSCTRCLLNVFVHSIDHRVRFYFSNFFLRMFFWFCFFFNTFHFSFVCLLMDSLLLSEAINWWSYCSRYIIDGNAPPPICCRVIKYFLLALSKKISGKSRSLFILFLTW